MVTAAAVGLGLTAASTLYGIYQGDKNNRMGAAALRDQSRLYGAMSGVSLQSAGLAAQTAGGYAQQAGAAAAMGRYNARNLRLQAGQLDRYEQFALLESVKQARARIGEGRASFAGNGVLVDRGAAARWEQDEAADAALERLDIMQQYEDQSWTLRTQANRAEAEGYAAAASQMGNAANQMAAAAGYAGQAYGQVLQSQSAARQAASAQRSHNRLKKYVTAAAGAAVGTIAAGPIGAAAGAYLGYRKG